MSNLLFCLNATFPVFLLMLLGFFFRKIKLFDDAFVAKANKFVFTIPLPLLLFQDLSTSDFHSTWNGAFILFCFTITLLSIGIAFILSLFFKKQVSQGEFVQGAYRSSAALLGIALIQNIYGNAGMAPLMIIGSVPLYNIMAVIVLEVLKPERGKLNRDMILHTLKGVITNPILIGIVVGILWSLLRIPQPAIIEKTVGYIAALATPLGLMAMGASFDIQKSLGHLKPSIVCCFTKLIGFCTLFLPLAIYFGFRKGELIAILIMLGSATTVSSFVMAKNMGHDGTLTANVVMLTTFFNAFTLTGWLYLLRMFGLI